MNSLSILENENITKLVKSFFLFILISFLFISCNKDDNFIITNQDKDPFIYIPILDFLENIINTNKDELSLKNSDDFFNTNKKKAVEVLGKLGFKSALKLLEGLSLEDENWYIRQSSASALGDLGFLDSLETLIKGCLDSDEYVKMEFAKALGRLQDKKGIPPLLHLLKDQSMKVRIEAEKALGLIFYPPNKSYLKELIENSSNEEKLVIIQSLYRLGERDLFKHIVGLLNDKDKLIRKKGIELIGNYGYKEGIPILINILKNKKESLRKESAISLGLLEAKEAIPYLEDAIFEDDPLLNIFATKALIRIDAKGLLSFLKANLSSSKEKRSNAIRALGLIGDKETLPLIYDSLKDFHWSVRASASFALYKFKDEKTTKLLIETSKDKSESVRINTIISLEGRQEDAIKTITSLLLEDENEQVRQISAKILGYSNNKSVIPSLIKALSDPSDPVKTSVIESLGELSAKESVTHLIKLIKGGGFFQKWITKLVDLGNKVKLFRTFLEILEKDSTPLLESSAIALGKIGDKNAIPYLIKLLSHPKERVRKGAVIGLGELKEYSTIKNLQPLLLDDDYYVREEVVKAIRKIYDSNIIRPLVYSLIEDYDLEVKRERVEILRKIEYNGIILYLEEIHHLLKPEIVDLVDNLMKEINYVSSSRFYD